MHRPCTQRLLDLSRQVWEMPWQRSLIIVLAVFAIHLVWRHSIIEYPPYWDALQGPFIEARWLIDHGFDYWRLAFAERGYDQDGPATYVWSVMPTLYALVYQAFDAPRRVMLVLHLANFLLSGMLAALLFEIVHGHLRLPLWCGLGAVLLVILDPAVSGQIDGVGMEIPSAVAILAAAMAMICRRPALAGGLGLLAVLVKESAHLIVLVNLIVGMAILWVDRPPWPQRLRIAGWLSLPLTAVWGAKALLRLNPVSHQTIPPSAGLAAGFDFLTDKIANQPILVGGATLCLLAVPLVVWRAGYWQTWRAEGFTAALRTWLAAPVHRAYFVATLASAGYLAVIVQVGFYVLYRYAVWYAALLILFVFLTVWLLRVPARVLAACLIAGIAFNLANQYGRWLPEIAPGSSHSGYLLERSRECTRDLKYIMAMGQWLDKHAGDRPVLVQSPYDRAFAMPALGYVSRPLNVYTATAVGRSYPPMPHFLTMTPAQYAGALISYVPSIYIHPDPLFYCPGGRIEVLERFSPGPRPVFVYRVIPPDPPLPEQPDQLLDYYLRLSPEARVP